MVVTLDSKWIGKVAVVTGASSGIGRATAERLVEEGMQVVGLARRLDLLEAIQKNLASKGGKFYPIKVDLLKEEDILNAFTWIKENLGPIHVLINNAGKAHLQLLTETDSKVFTDLLQVNVVSLCAAFRETIKSMKENNVNGHIVNMSSILGHIMPNMCNTSLYIPSKHAIKAISELLRNELKFLGSKIKVTNLSPGLTDTELVNNSKTSVKEFQDLGNTIAFLKPEDVAESIVYVISTPPFVQVTELVIRPLGETF